MHQRNDGPDEFQKEKAEALKKIALLRYMTKNARERLNRLRVVKPQVAESVELALLQALQAGQIKEVIGDEQLKNILAQSMNSKDFNLKINKK